MPCLLKRYRVPLDVCERTFLIQPEYILGQCEETSRRIFTDNPGFSLRYRFSNSGCRANIENERGANVRVIAGEFSSIYLRYRKWKEDTQHQNA